MPTNVPIVNKVLALVSCAMVLAASRPAAAQQVQAQGVIIIGEEPAPQGPVLIADPAPQTVVAQPYVQSDGSAQSQSAYIASTAAAPPSRGTGHVGLIVSGAVILGVTWVLNFIVGAAASLDEHLDTDPAWDTFRGVSFIPVLGPLVQLAVKPTGFEEDDWATWLLIDEALQLTGLTLLILGIVLPSEDDGGMARVADGLELAVLPSLSTGQSGLTLVGRF